MKLTLYHNPRCAKSRQTLALVQESGAEVEIVKYLETPLSRDQLHDILKRLGIPAEELLRKNEKTYKEHYKGKTLTEEEAVEAMVSYPILMERPVVVKGDRAIIGRPPENVKALL